MKTRTCFISNSSSSSFILKRKMISDAQMEKIMNHIEEAQKMGMEVDSDCRWNHIEETDIYVFGYTSKEMFSMEEFFKKIKIPKKAYKFKR